MNVVSSTIDGNQRIVLPKTPEQRLLLYARGEFLWMTMKAKDLRLSVWSQSVERRLDLLPEVGFLRSRWKPKDLEPLVGPESVERRAWFDTLRQR